MKAWKRFRDWWVTSSPLVTRRRYAAGLNAAQRVARHAQWEAEQAAMKTARTHLDLAAAEQGRRDLMAATELVTASARDRIEGLERALETQWQLRKASEASAAAAKLAAEEAGARANAYAALLTEVRDLCAPDRVDVGLSDVLAVVDRMHREVA